MDSDALIELEFIAGEATVILNDLQVDENEYYCQLTIPEMKLLEAVLLRALKDLLPPSTPRHTKEAIQWFNSSNVGLEQGITYSATVWCLNLSSTMCNRIDILVKEAKERIYGQ